jgi:uncharacterized protein YjbI with pentapeptide repeats
MTTFSIKNRWTGAVQYTCELSAEAAGLSASLQLGFAVKSAVAIGADLGGANLRGSNLRDANLGEANLRDANLGGADLGGANLCGANLRGSNLRDADLGDANLGEANLRDADLRGADLCGANLRGSNLRGANLRGSNLRGADLGDANLGGVKQDFLAEVLRLPDELEFLRSAIVEGRIDGSTYKGDCACLAGTLAKSRYPDQEYSGYSFDVAPGVIFHAASGSPREIFFTAIRPGDTPKNNSAAAIALSWTDEAIAIRDMIRATAPSVDKRQL